MKVGTAKITGPNLHGIYIGPNALLKGKGSLLRSLKHNAKYWGAQFDDIRTGFGFGWFEFPKEVFKVSE
jgi:hypothetical protein